MKTLLVTTIGGLVGDAILKVLASLRDRIRVVGMNSRADSTTNFVCDTTYLVPETSDAAAWTDRVRDILRTERPDLVIAGRDGDLVPLAALKTDPEFAATPIHAPGPETAAIVIDKYATSIFGRRHGLPFVDTAVTDAEIDRLIAEHGYPLVAKPRRTHGGLGVRALAGRSEVDACRARGGMVFQPFIGPPPDLGAGAMAPGSGVPLFFDSPWYRYLAASVTVDAKRRVTFRGAVDIDIRSRLLTHVMRADAPDIARVACGFAEALAALDFEGPLSIQGRRGHDGRFMAFEANGRINGGVHFRSLLGIAEMASVLEILLGESWRMPEPDPDEGAIVGRRLDWHLIRPADLDRLRSTGMWTSDGSPPGGDAGTAQRS